MSKINIIFGSMGNQLANYKTEKKQKEIEYKNLESIIRSREYMISELLRSQNYLKINYKNIETIFNLFFDENQYWESLIRIYNEFIQNEDNQNITDVDEIYENISIIFYNTFPEIEESYDKESISILIKLFITVVQLDGSLINDEINIDNSIINIILNDEREYVRSQKVIQEQLSQEIANIDNKISTIVQESINNSNNIQPTTKTVINKIQSICENINETLTYILNKHKDDKKFQNIQLLTINDALVTQIDNQINETVNNENILNTEGVAIPSILSNNDEIKEIIVDGTALSKYEIVIGDGTQIISGIIRFKYVDGSYKDITSESEEYSKINKVVTVDNPNLVQIFDSVIIGKKSGITNVNCKYSYYDENTNQTFTYTTKIENLTII